MIPACLETHEDYLAATESSRHQFQQRMVYLKEISGQLGSLFQKEESISRWHIDDIELDIYSSFALLGSHNEATPWLIHSSWTFNYDPESMAHAVSPLFTTLFSLPPVGFESKYEETADWLKKWADAASETFRRFEAAQSAEVAIAQCIAIDALFSAVLTFSALIRFNTAWSKKQSISRSRDQYQR